MGIKQRRERKPRHDMETGFQSTHWRSKKDQSDTKLGLAVGTRELTHPHEEGSIKAPGRHDRRCVMRHGADVLLPPVPLSTRCPQPLGTVSGFLQPCPSLQV